MADQEVRGKILPVMIKWVLANLYGWTLGLCLGTLLTYAASQFNLVNEDRGFIYIVLLSAGLACGATQWVVMRDILPSAQSWILGTLAGYILAILTMQLFILGRPGAIGSWTDILLLPLMGTAIGVPQWWLLRTKYRRTGLWIFATGIGFLAFLWLIRNPASSETGFILTAAILGGIAAVTTGAVLAWMMRQPGKELS